MGAARPGEASGLRRAQRCSGERVLQRQKGGCGWIGSGAGVVKRHGRCGNVGDEMTVTATMMMRVSMVGIGRNQVAVGSEWRRHAGLRHIGARHRLHCLCDAAPRRENQHQTGQEGEHGAHDACS